MNQRQRGFTLIELMIVIAIVGILASIAMPSYRDYVRKANMTVVTNLGGSLADKAIVFYNENGVWPDRDTPAHREAVLGSTDNNVFNTLGGGDLITRTETDDRVGKGQIYIQVNGTKIGMSGNQWLRLQLTDSGSIITKDWCSTGDSVPTPPDAYPYLPC